MISRLLPIDSRVPFHPVLVFVLTCVLMPSCSERPEGAVRPHVLLITIDTLRADHLGTYGYRLDTSPNIDRLAERGVLFEDCTVQRTKTRPSMASLLTGAYPKAIGVVQDEHHLVPDSFLLLSEVFRDADYGTGAVVANFNVSRKFGFDQGFDHFVESWRQRWEEEKGSRPFKNEPGRVKSYTNAALVTDQGLRVIRALTDDRPFFVWLHYMDPHGPYVPPEAYRRLFTEDHAAQPTSLSEIPWYQKQRDGVNQPIADLGFYKAQYDSEIRYLDDQLERLFSELEAMHLDRELLVVFTADHGESLDEHDYYLAHGKLPYQPSARVPCIVQSPSIEGGRRVDAPVGLVDLTATIAELAGFEIPATFEGKSLAGLVRGEPAAVPPLHVFMESGHYGPSQLIVREGRWKLIHVRSPKDRLVMAGVEYELYDVVADPRELQERSAEEPEVVLRLAERLSDWYRKGPRALMSGKVDPDTLDPREVEMLRSLGYLN